MRAPYEEHCVHVQDGARTQILPSLTLAAVAEGMLPRELLDQIGLDIKAVRDGCTVGPRHREVPSDEMPASYREAYSSIHDEFYYGLWVRYGIKSELNRLVLISMSYAPALGLPED